MVCSVNCMLKYWILYIKNYYMAKLIGNNKILKFKQSTHQSNCYNIFTCCCAMKSFMKYQRTIFGKNYLGINIIYI